MGWLAFNFECESVGGREALVDWFEEHHDVEWREPRSSIGKEKKRAMSEGGDDEPPDVDQLDHEAGPPDHGQSKHGGGPPDGVVEAPEVVADVTLSTDNGPVEGEMARVDRYLYLTVTADPGPLLEETATYWSRAVHAQIETRSQGCRVAVLYTTVGSHAVEVARYGGGTKGAAIDVMYILAMKHQFRFRAYADILPQLCPVPFPNAFHVPDQTDPDGEKVQELAEKTGVEPTREGIRFVRRDPLRPEEDRPAIGPHVRIAATVRSRIVRPLHAAVVALKGQLGA